MIVKALVLDDIYYKYEEFAKNIYKAMYKSEKYNKLKYIRLKINKDIGCPHGVSYKSTVTLFLRQIMLDKGNIIEEDMKGYIAFVIAHELSHQLQDININLYHTDIKYRNFIEASADVDAASYLKENYTSLTRISNFSLNIMLDQETAAINYFKQSGKL